MITVNVKLFASLGRKYPDHAQGQTMPVQLPDNSTLDYLINHLDLTKAHIVIVNGIAQTNRKFTLQNDDELAVFPLLAGG